MGWGNADIAGGSGTSVSHSNSFATSRVGRVACEISLLHHAPIEDVFDPHR
jgi:hypothetical protein